MSPLNNLPGPGGHVGGLLAPEHANTAGARVPPDAPGPGAVAVYGGPHARARAAAACKEWRARRLWAVVWHRLVSRTSQNGAHAMPHDESSSALVPADDVDPALGDGETLSDLVSEQDEQAQEFAIEFFKKVIRLRGVQIDRDDYLRQELHKLGLDDATISLAQETTPVQAGLTPAQLDQLAADTIAFETRKSATISFAAGLPGGFAMLATIPGDVTQYYVHTFRIMQKLSYIYGWKDFLGGLDEVDDETLGKMSLFLGVMMGVGGASASLTIFAKQIARPALQEQIAKQALTKTAWYGPMKHTLKLIGIKITKDSFAKGVTKTVPVAGGLISGGMTFAALNIQSTRLQRHLRKLPPPGVNAAEYLAALRELDAQADEPGALANAQAKVKGATGEAAARVRSAGGSLLRKARWRRTADGADDLTAEC